LLGKASLWGKKREKGKEDLVCGPLKIAQGKGKKKKRGSLGKKKKKKVQGYRVHL